MGRTAAEGYGHPQRARARPIIDPGPDDHARVARWGRLRMGWAAIARNLGMAEADVRRLFDPSFKPGDTP